MSAADPFIWHDPWQAIEDAAWLKVTREDLKLKNRAWEACHAERMTLWTRVRELETQTEEQADA